MTNEEERAAKRRRFSSNIITLKVGKKLQTLTAHEDRIREKSPFFRAALDKHWKEGETGVIELKDDHVDTVTTFLDWLYGSPVAVVEDTSNGFKFDMFGQLYVFGEKIQDDAFCDDVLTAFAKQVDVRNSENTRSFPGKQVYFTIYNGTCAGSPARRFLVQLACERRDSTWTSKGNEERPVEFLHDFIEELWRRSKPIQSATSLFDRRAEWMKQKP